MGYDVSAHPVDVELIQHRILPYIRGEGNIDDLVETAVRLAQVRFRANAWGLGLLEVSHKESDAKRKKPKKKAGAKGEKKSVAKPKWLVPDAFDSGLHVWGRPFFITTPSDRVSESIDRYLAATPRQVDKIAEDMLRELNPALVGKVEPSTEGKLPGPKKLGESIRFAIDFYRNAYPNLKSGKPVRLPNEEEVAAADLFLGSFGLDVVTFASQLQPGWMSRGYVWFTAFIDRAMLDASKFVESAAPLFQPMWKDVKGLRGSFETSIISNYSLGGYVPPNRVPDFRVWMEKNTEKMIAACVKEDWDEAASRADFLKVMEPLRDAERRGMGFLEAAEVYSGFMGVMN